MKKEAKQSLTYNTGNNIPKSYMNRMNKEYQEAKIKGDVNSFLDRHGFQRDNEAGDYVFRLNKGLT